MNRAASIQLTRFQFLGIPPKGEPPRLFIHLGVVYCFQFLGIPPKGERATQVGGEEHQRCFQFLGIPPKGELLKRREGLSNPFRGFQFLGIPPKGERLNTFMVTSACT